VPRAAASQSVHSYYHHSKLIWTELVRHWQKPFLLLFVDHIVLQQNMGEYGRVPYTILYYRCNDIVRRGTSEACCERQRQSYRGQGKTWLEAEECCGRARGRYRRGSGCYCRQGKTKSAAVPLGAMKSFLQKALDIAKDADTVILLSLPWV
jgi:hypothetical protein